MAFFLESVREAAEAAVDSAKRLFARVDADRRTVLNHDAATVTAIRLFDALPDHPILTVAQAEKLLNTSKPTAGNAVQALCQANVLDEITGKPRDRVYRYSSYLRILAEDTDIPAER